MIFFSSSYLLLPLLSTLLSMGGKRNRNPNKNQQQQKQHCLKSGTHHMDIYRQIGSDSDTGDDASSSSTPASLSSAIWIDMENVRGKSGFLLSHQDVLDKIEMWMNHFHLQNKVIIVVDHGGDRGSQPSAYYLEDKKFAIIFSGNACKADDIIAKGIGDETCFTFFNNNNSGENNENNTSGGKNNIRGKTIVVTADVELISRCRRAAKNEYHFINPQTFLDDLEFVVQQEYQNPQQQIVGVVDELKNQNGEKNGDDEEEEVSTSSSTSSSLLTVEEKSKLDQLDIEIKLRGQLLDAEIQLGDRRKRKTNNKRKKLDSRVQSLRRKLALRGPSLLDQLTKPSSSSGDSDDDDDNDRYVEGIPRDQQDILLARWKEVQNNPTTKRNRKEQTGDRIIYAERLRRELEDNRNAISAQIVVPNTEDDNSDAIILPSAKAFVNHINGYKNPSGKSGIGGSSSSSSSSALSTPKSFYDDSTASTAASTAANIPRAVATTENENTVANIDVDVDDTITTPKLSTEELLKVRNDELEQEDDDDEAQVMHESIDIVVVSDTHGFEDQLGDKLPDGDVLLHLGDFALDGSKQAEYRSLIKFDTWLAKQDHIPYKIVVRGNHDPIRYDFTTSKAMYVTTPKKLNIYGFDFTLIPYGNARKLSESGVLKGQQQQSKSKSSPSNGSNNKAATVDSSLIIASHIPPYKILDKTYTGKHVGSSFLINSIRRLPVPPKLWLVGHIHEGRGIAKRKFGSSAKNKYDETTIINAANANLGMATHLENGPVVVRVHHNNNNNDVDNNNPNIEILKMDDKNINQRLFSNSNEGSFFGGINNNGQQQQQPVAGGGNDYYDDDSDDDDSIVNKNTNKLLMSVDLGLKSGISLFSNTGFLLRYEQFDFLNREKLQNDIIDIMYKWENEVVQEAQVQISVVDNEDDNEVDGDDIMDEQKDEESSSKWKITHIAIEGGDVELLDIWSNAAAPNNYSILRVSPEEWRSELLTNKECSNGKSAKEASRLIARQIVNDYGCDTMDEHTGKFQTDVAESVCLGMYVSRRLGWIEQREPVIRRYTNGNIIIPPKKKK